MPVSTRLAHFTACIAALGVLLTSATAFAQVASITRGGLGNSPSWNWPAGTWNVAAMLVDANGAPIGGLSAGYSYTHSGTTYPAFVTVDMVASAPDASHFIRVYRSQDPLVPGTFGADYAEYACDAGGGVLEDFCNADSAGSYIGGGSGYLIDPDFTASGTVPGGGDGVGALTRGGLGNSPSWNWPAGTWEVAALLLDAEGELVGGLSQGYAYTHSGTTYPAFVGVDMLASAPDASHWIRVYRKQGTLAPGTFGADYAEYSCDAGSGVLEDFCDADSAGSNIDGGSGLLPEPDFAATGTVLGGGEGVGALTRTGLGNSPSWNWPAGTWEVVAYLVDGAGQPIGGLSQGYSYTHSGTTYPAFVRVDMLSSAPSGAWAIRVLRKQGPITDPFDYDAEFADYGCSDGLGGVAEACDADTAASLVNDFNGHLREPDFRPLTPTLVPLLGPVERALLVGLVLASAAAALASRRAEERRRA